MSDIGSRNSRGHGATLPWMLVESNLDWIVRTCGSSSSTATIRRCSPRAASSGLLTPCRMPESSLPRLVACPYSAEHSTTTTTPSTVTVACAAPAAEARGRRVLRSAVMRGGGVGAAVQRWCSSFPLLSHDHQDSSPLIDSVPVSTLR